ncbi:hypothetical protein [Beijerinckia sp. L45]|uniref:hypothetical protein n=1 Tax=Beijerinckia sp. L45 TaxID=1641855 RepID=UPI00131E3878|nr:hypothetical protein [Beijerinckia sp. L45]
MPFKHPTFACLALGLAVATAAIPALAQDAGPKRLRGTIESVDGATLKIKPAAGDAVTLHLADGFKVVAAAKGSLADVKTGSYVGIANQVSADGKQDAVEVHIFPEAMRGTGDGQRPWDLGKSSKMTNGAVGSKVAGVDGQNLEITYKGGTSTIQVKPTTQIMLFGPGTASDLIAGAHVFVREAKPAADGVLQAGYIVVGKDGLAPAM